MAEFTAITTQEQLDAIIGSRLKEDRERRKNEGWLSPKDAEARVADLQKQIEDLTKEKDSLTASIAEKDTSIAERDASIKRYETASVKSRVADEIGLNRKLIDRISGETEDDIRKDAQALKDLFGTSQSAPPLGSTEQGGKSTATSAWAKVASQLNE